MALETWLLLFLTCCGVAVVPGPTAFLVLAHGALYGKRQTLFTIFGGLFGLFAMIIVCALGLNVLVHTSATLFTAIKMAGGLYLIWLGIGLWRTVPVAIDLMHAVNPDHRLLFRQGMLTAISNPKALLLFIAFIPPFLDPAYNLLLQACIIALTYTVAEFGVEFAVAFAAHRVRPWLTHSGQRFNKICGVIFMIFGIVLPFS